MKHGRKLILDAATTAAACLLPAAAAVGFVVFSTLILQSEDEEDSHPDGGHRNHEAHPIRLHRLGAAPIPATTLMSFRLQPEQNQRTQ